MLGFSMIKCVRKHGHLLDRHMKSELVNLYRPFRMVPCFMHWMLENRIKKRKKFPVLVEFTRENDGYRFGFHQLQKCIHGKKRCALKRQYKHVHCCVADLTAEAIEILLAENDYIKKIHYDRKVEAFLDKATAAVRADQVHRFGLDGSGVNIAVLDTGIHPHADLTTPENRIIAFKDFINDEEDPYDDNGHGTHCAGDAAGNGYASDGVYVGPAPEANVIGVKVLDKMGAGSLSTVIDGVEWCIEHQSEYNIHVMSLSLGSDSDQPAEDDPIAQAVERAWEAGIVVCAAAGNSGPQEKSIGTPGISPSIITVGAMDDQDTPEREDDEVANFSSRGPTAGDNLEKPDLLAPGVDVISLRSPGSYLDKMMRNNLVDRQYISLSGTSMATPICAGIVALMLQDNPNMTPDDVKERLLETCEDWGLSPNTQGHGYVDAVRATGAE